MLECLPQLDGGCVNYWDAGNWALNDAAEPAGPKRGPAHRVLHQHVIGRSRHSSDPDWRWGESPFFPAFADRLAWSRGKASLTPAECAAIVGAGARRAAERATACRPATCRRASTCVTCGYPAPRRWSTSTGRCATCADERR